MWLSWIVNDRIYVIQLIKQFSHEKSFTYFIELKLRRLIDSRGEEKKNEKFESMWCVVGTESIYPINDKMLRFWKRKCSSNRKVFITLKSACAIKSRYSIWLCISHSYTMDDCKAYSENRFPIQLLNTAFIFMLSLFTPNLPASIRKRFLKLQGIDNVMRKTKSKIDKEEEKEDDRMN